MQDGAQPHNTNNVTALLNQEFDYWIGNKSQTLGPATGEREEPIKWPARSPCITPMDFGYWPYIKNKLYADGPIFNNIEELRAEIIRISNEIPRETIENWIESYEQRLHDCTLVQGRHFEQVRKKTVPV